MIGRLFRRIFRRRSRGPTIEWRTAPTVSAAPPPQPSPAPESIAPVQLTPQAIAPVAPVVLVPPAPAPPAAPFVTRPVAAESQRRSDDRRATDRRASDRRAGDRRAQERRTGDRRDLERDQPGPAPDPSLIQKIIGGERAIKRPVIAPEPSTPWGAPPERAEPSRSAPPERVAPAARASEPVAPSVLTPEPEPLVAAPAEPSIVQKLVAAKSAPDGSVSTPPPPPSNGDWAARVPPVKEPWGAPAAVDTAPAAVVTPAETAPAEAPPTELAPAEVEPGLVPLSGIEALEHTEPGRVILVLQDGSVEDVPADPEVAERARYLADNLIRRDPPAS